MVRMAHWHYQLTQANIYAETLLRLLWLRSYLLMIPEGMDCLYWRRFLAWFVAFGIICIRWSSRQKGFIGWLCLRERE